MSESKADAALVVVFVTSMVLIPFRVAAKLLALAWEFSGEASTEIVNGMREGVDRQSVSEVHPTKPTEPC